MLKFILWCVFGLVTQLVGGLIIGAMFDRSDVDEDAVMDATRDKLLESKILRAIVNLALRSKTFRVIERILANVLAWIFWPVWWAWVLPIGYEAYHEVKAQQATEEGLS